MARRLRIDIEGGIHHVMNRGVDRQPIFFADADRVEFGRRLAHIHDEYGVETLAYCLMGNHYHLLLCTPRGRLSAAMQHLAGVYTRHVNDRLDRDGPLFRGRFHSITVTTDNYLLAATRYIHRNPLDLTGVSSPASYRWSSYRSYLGLRPTPAFLSTDLMLGLHGDTGAMASFTERPLEAFALDRLDAADLVAFADLAIAQDDLAHGGDEMNRPWRVRTLLALVLAATEGRGVHDQLLDLFAFPSDTARRMAISRARKRERDDASIRRVLESLLRDLGLQPHAA